MITYYYLSSFLFIIGLIGALIKEDVISILMSIQLMIMSVGLLFVLFSKNLGDLEGAIQVFFIFIMNAVQLVLALGLAKGLLEKNKSVYTGDLQRHRD